MHSHKEIMTDNQSHVPEKKRSRISLLQHFYNLPISRKQMIALIACELVSILGIGIGATLIITQGLRNQLFEQAKSEVAVTNIAYNIKVNQMGFGFRGQSDNPSIIQAANIHNSGKALNRESKVEIKQILENEIKARNIEYATLVGKDLKIIANANNDRTGEEFNPDNLVSEVLNNPKQIKANRIVSWSEISKEASPLPEGFNNQDALIRYTITPVKDPTTQAVIGVLISGDIVNNKYSIVRETLNATGGGYSAIYFRQANGEFALATSLNQLPSEGLKQAITNVKLPENAKSLLEAATKVNEGQVVTGRFVVGNQTYTMAAKTLPNKTVEESDGTRVSFNEKPIVILLRGTPELALNNLLTNSFIQQLLTVLIALILVGIWAIILRRSIIKPVKNLQQVAQKFTTSIRNGKPQQIRAEVFATDEIGELTTNFNTMADSIYQQIKYRENEVILALQLNAITAGMRESLNQEKVLKSAVIKTHEALKAGRVLYYQLPNNYQIKENCQTQVISESVDYNLPATLGMDVNNPYDVAENFEDLEIGTIKIVENIEDVEDLKLARISKSSIKQLKPLLVKAYLLAPVFVNKKLQGLLVAHHCLKPHKWQDSEINLFKQVAIQVGYAIEQAQLVQQIEQGRQNAENTSHEERQQKETLQMQLLELLEDVEGVASGDLTVRADVSSSEIGTVADFFNSIVENLHQIVYQVKTTATQVNYAISSNSGEIDKLAEEALTQVAEINNTLGAVDRMTGSMQNVADHARQAATVANQAARNAEQSEQVIERTVEQIIHMRETVGETAKKVKRLGESTQQVSRVVSLINQIAVQTNLLAINAGIEAARAGEEGQGFAVVAEEVGELASRSHFATQEIEGILENIQKETNELVEVMELETIQVVEGTRVVEDAKHSLNQILEVSRQVDSLVNYISSATDSQVETSQIISELIKQIAETSHRTSTSSRRVSESLQQTVEISQQLQETVATFKVG
jgi:twitching motility protein PilJ